MSITEAEFERLLDADWNEIHPSLIPTKKFWGENGLLDFQSQYIVHNRSSTSPHPQPFRFIKSDLFRSLAYHNSSLFRNQSSQETKSLPEFIIPPLSKLFRSPLSDSNTNQQIEIENDAFPTIPLFWKLIPILQKRQPHTIFDGYLLCVTDCLNVWISRASREQISLQYKSYVELDQRSRSDTVQKVFETYVDK